ncbi:type I-C CRISPR-associated protein Cas8c/Csd1 [Neglectibacter caecimuris]|uniref:type I-C CRISPR-associated protein Cas8c/Csd1 n=1 Tax=Neglectibacter caecimuris TaxID=3093658 RepID=UPI002AC8A219|nr:type I-C CRISPR-associated protein Cas8c/Csd1 [Neglectibacter sp. M00184]
MGLLQKACETYDTFSRIAGIEQEGKEPLAPISHSITRADLEITLDQNGAFLSARTVDKKEPKILIPVTEESFGRTSAPCAHPLCDQLGYLAPCNREKYSLYLAQLEDWESSGFSHPKLTAILRYIQGETILSDLSRCELITVTETGAPENEKLLVRWVVNGLGEQSGPCWRDRSLMQCFTRYYHSKLEAEAPVFCMVSGQSEAPATQHPKGVVSLNGNAKLISANDSHGFTYRGRFSEPSQAATVSYIASQKAHNALRWLVANEGVIFGERTFLCWNPAGKRTPMIHSSMQRGQENGTKAATLTEYRQQLKNALAGWKQELPDTSEVIVTAFDAATTGRLAVTCYSEFQASDYLERLFHWEDTCLWENFQFGIQSPSLYAIVNRAFGVPRNGKVETDPKILGQQMQRLISYRLNGAFFPLDMEKSLVERASNLLLYEEKKFYEYSQRKELLFTACAVIRKYRYDHFKEEWDMALDQENKDRSYLFGRLLAIAEIVEQSTYQGEDARETNAMRFQKTFSLRPMATWRLLEEKLRPYYKQLKPGLSGYYKKLTQEITALLDPKDPELNKKLEDVYLLGYYHQRAYRNAKAED